MPTYDIHEIRQEAVAYTNKTPEAFQAALLSDQVFLNKFTTPVTKVDGEFPSIVSLMSHVVQAFYSKKFTPFGDVTYKKKTLKTFKQKVDFVLDPADILGTVFAAKYDEGKKLQDKTISKETYNMLLAKIMDDVDLLSVIGEYDASKVGIDNPVFGASMDGLNVILENLPLDTDNPAYLLPGDAITANNILAQVTAFEKNLPAKAKPKVKYIFTSLEDVEEYQEAYDDAYGSRPSFKDADTVRTRFGKRELIGIPNLAKGTLFTTIDKNFLRLLDIIDNPATITDIQVQDRILKFLGEFTLAYDFGINQMVYLHTADGTKNLGLNDSVQNKLFYPTESKIA